MDGYRQTLLGRALADALRDIEAAGGEAAAAVDGDQVFALFDDAVREELAAGLRASGRRRRGEERGAETESAGASEQRDPPPAVFTHRSLALDARLRSFNRFEDQWSLQAAVPSGGIVLDHVPLRWGADREHQERTGGGDEDGDSAGEAADGEELPILVKLQQVESKTFTN